MPLGRRIGPFVACCLVAAFSYGYNDETGLGASPTSHALTTVTTTSSQATPTTTAYSDASAPTSTVVSPVELTHPGCRPDPFADGVADDLAAAYPGKSITAHVYDARTGCEYSLNPENRQLTASVFKVLVMAGTLLEAQTDSREVTDWETSQLTQMITRSANSPVRALWRSFGASPWFRDQGQLFGLDETAIAADGGSSWGGTRTSASDQVDLLRQVLLGEWGSLNKSSRQTALSLMKSVVPEQAWGVSAGVPHTWTVSQKNGFAGSIVNSMGWLDEPGESQGYVVAILTRGWPNQLSGIDVVEQISVLIACAMIEPTWTAD